MNLLLFNVLKSDTPIQVPDGITGISILLIAGYIILQKLPAIINSISDLIQTVVANRKQQNVVFQDLTEQMKKDRDYFDQERKRMQDEIDELRKEIQELRIQADKKDKEISELRSQLGRGN